MLNALLLHAENVVDREDLVWKGTDNRPGLGDITLAKPSVFARYIPEGLQAYIHKLKKAVKRYSEAKERLEASSRNHGKELQECLQQVSMNVSC
jgi:hypothetical protein